MKAIAVFAALVAVSNAQIIYNGGVIGYNGLGYNGLGYNGLHHGLGYSSVVAAPVVAAPVVAAATKTQYHAQDELGQASFGHSQADQAHAAVRGADGSVRGTFSYIGAEGIPFTTHYTADHNGYRVASNALPVAPAVQVIDTPEVAAAKAQHAAAHAEALVRSGRKKRGLIAGYTPAATAPLATPVVTYAAAPAITYAAAPAVTYAAAPALTYAAHAPVVHAAHAPVVHAAPVAYSSSVISSPAVRSAVLTKIVNTPGHAVSYRVD